MMQKNPKDPPRKGTGDVKDLIRGTNLQNSAWSKLQWLWSYFRLLQLFNINLFCCVMLFEETIFEFEKKGRNKLQVEPQNYQAGQF